MDVDHHATKSKENFFIGWDLFVWMTVPFPCAANCIFGTTLRHWNIVKLTIPKQIHIRCPLCSVYSCSVIHSSMSTNRLAKSWTIQIFRCIRCVWIFSAHGIDTDIIFHVPNMNLLRSYLEMSTPVSIHATLSFEQEVVHFTVWQNAMRHMLLYTSRSWLRQVNLVGIRICVIVAYGTH